MCNEIQSRIRETIANYTLFDDVFMSEVFNNNNELTQYVLRVILQKDDLTVTSVESQHSMINIMGRGARLDIEAFDSEGNYYDVEVQRASKPGIFERARFYQALMDAEQVNRGADFKDIRKSYIIFILDYDLYGNSQPIYHVESHIRENGEPYDDGRRILFVNGTYRNTDEEIGSLMHDFSCSDYREIRNELIRETVHPYKDTNSKEYVKMSELFERIFGDELEKVRAEVKEKDQIIESKDVLIKEKDTLLEEKDSLIEEKDCLIEKKNQENELLKKLLRQNGIDCSNLQGN
ncbi:MAG: Rpn family recombination-promoting nuclease/putative transposase [Erysipelotrichaceae bacterium]|nr:Rpn family recombination-promoting nuclease/putative transposase [Erysipelotrichaceae bacterium]